MLRDFSVKSKFFLFLFLLFIIALLTVAIVLFRQQHDALRPGTTMAWDFESVFSPAARAMITGDDPYQVDGFYNPFWILIPILPFAFIPSPWGHGLFAAASIALYVFAAWKIGVRNRFALAILAALNLFAALAGNIESLSLMGMILPPQVGLFFLLAKPQNGLAVALVWMWSAYRERGLVGLSRLVLPVLGGFIFSIVFYGDWFARAAEAIGKNWNASLWPWSLLIGLPILGASILRKDIRLALIAGPFLSPYISIWAYEFALIGILATDWSEVRHVAEDICSGALPLCEVPRFLWSLGQRWH